MSILGTIKAAARYTVSQYASAYTVRRQAAGSYSTTTGRWVNGVISEIEVMANIQPVPGHMLKALPEGRVSKDMIRIFTTTQLQTESAESGLQADIFVKEGTSYQIIYTKDYSGYTEAVGSKVGV
jgi:hypothetical protein